MTSVLWLELTAEELRAKAAADTIVVLPVGSVEQHGPHLPVGVDTILTGAVCKAAAERVGDGSVVVAPTLWCGMAEHHMPFGGTFTFDIPTYRAVLLAFLKSIERHGFRRVLIVNGHGGNTNALQAFLPDFSRETDLAIMACTYFDMAEDAITSSLDDQTRMMHACEVETSMMMAVAPDLVRTARLPDAHDNLAPEARGKGRASVARHRSYREKTLSGVSGDARRASPGKGEAMVEACAETLANWLRNREVWS
jgi:creatinine amidohydrolase